MALAGGAGAGVAEYGAAAGPAECCQIGTYWTYWGQGNPQEQLFVAAVAAVVVAAADEDAPVVVALAAAALAVVVPAALAVVVALAAG